MAQTPSHKIVRHKLQTYDNDGSDSSDGSDVDEEYGDTYQDRRYAAPWDAHTNFVICFLLLIITFNIIAWVGSRASEHAAKYSNLGACTFGTAWVCLCMSMMVCLRTCINDKRAWVKVCRYLEVFLMLVQVAIATFATYTVVGPEGEQAKEHFNFLNLIIWGNTIITLVLVCLKVLKCLSCASTFVTDLSQPLVHQHQGVKVETVEATLKAPQEMSVVRSMAEASLVPATSQPTVLIIN